METSGNKLLVKRGSEKEVTSQKGRYKSKCYGRRKENNNLKTLIGKKKKKEVDSGNATDEVDANTIDDFVVQQPSLARMRSTKDSLGSSMKNMVKEMKYLI